ncbi:hypothetical protein [Polyangium sp. 15x6]|uniref:OB-fold protein n=1 Tax=Polyangium sp. 15x6 TaxID=3042687 RepID=UPI00249C0BE1|nr:hypothetical protein [Polyangium sp. 15x6]MDI3291996.1 hypothetical protein [Polyangium sp. 15x6]
MRQIALALLTLSLAACCNLGKKSPPSSESSESGTAANSASTAPTPAPAAPARDFTGRPSLMVSAKDVLDEYKNNEVRADGKFKDKIVQIRGKVGDVKKDITDSIYVTVGTGATLEIPEVQCFVKDGEAKAAAALNKGEDVTVIGRVDGLLMNVLVKDCVINPNMKLCDRMRVALGGPGECKAGELTALHMPDKTEIAVVCVAEKEKFDKVTTSASLKTTDNRASLVSSSQSLCMAIMATEKGPIPQPLIDKVQKALDTL